MTGSATGTPADGSSRARPRELRAAPARPNPTWSSVRASWPPSTSARSGRASWPRPGGWPSAPTARFAGPTRCSPPTWRRGARTSSDVSRVVTSVEVGSETEAEPFLQPRDGLMLERAVAPGRFEAVEGPLQGYRRSVEVEPLEGDRLRVTQTVEYRLDLPFVGWPFALAMLICVSIAAAEEMPAGSRAYAISVLGLAGAFGTGITSMLLPLADAAPWGWRLLYAAPLAALPLVVSTRRRLPETRRFARPHPEVGLRGHGSRFWLLAASAVLVALFATPASFFANRYLLTEHGFSAVAITAFTLGTGTPGVLGVVIGGRLADTRGRRPGGAVALAVGTVCAAMVFLSSGVGLWVWAVVGSVIGAAAVPALGVYGPELFPTSPRGRARGLLALAALTGRSR